MPDTMGSSPLSLSWLMATYSPATKAAARTHVTNFQALEFLSYANENVDEYLHDVKKELEAVESIKKELLPVDAPGTIVYQLSQSTVLPLHHRSKI